MPGPGKKPATMRARPGGGFNLGGGFNEHLDESAMQQAMQQKQLTQAQADPATAQAAAQKAQSQTQAQKPPPEIGSLTDELIKRPIQGIWREIKKFFSLNTWLGINPNTTDPEKREKMKQVHQRYQQLDQEQQAVARKLFQESEQKKKAEKEEEMRKKQMDEQKKAQELVMPASPQKGAVGPGGSRKKQAQARLQQQMKTIGTVAGAD